MRTPSKAGVNDIYIRIHVSYSKRMTLTALSTTLRLYSARGFFLTPKK
jgi:hypothetical protein